MSWIPAFSFISALGIGGMTYFFADNYIFDSLISNMPDNIYTHILVIAWRVLPFLVLIAVSFGFLMRMQKRNYTEYM